ncbi:MAG: hypothetical protein AAGK47_03885, partial [Bacteroidota bacterium]
MNKSFTLRHLSVRCILLAIVYLGSVQSPMAQLIFSEYIDGPQNNNAIEIANVSDVVVSLNFYRLEFYNDGQGGAAFTKPLTGSIAPGQAIAYTSGIAEDPALQGYEHFAGNFNGNDAIVLRRGGTIVDIIGNRGCDPGPGGWIIGGVSTTGGRIERLGCVKKGAADPGGSCPPAAGSDIEWIGSSDNTFYRGLGFFQSTGVAPDIEDQTICEGQTATLSAETNSPTVFGYRWSTGDVTPSISVSPTATTTYSVTVEDSGCFFTGEAEVVVKPAFRFTLNNYGPFCENDNVVNLPSSQNGEFGDWSGPGVVGFRLNPRIAGPGVHTLTFTPNDVECYQNNTTTFEVFEQVQPTLSALPSLCSQDAPLSLSTDQGGVLGNWSGSGVSNNVFNPSGLSGSIQLTFTPIDCGQSATTSIEVQAAVTPALQSIGPVCELSAPINLPTQQQGITGSWSGVGVSGNEFLPNGNAGDNTLQFTPDPGQCANSGTLNVRVVAERQLAPPFFAPVCSSDAVVSLGNTINNVSGNWSGQGVSNNAFNPQGQSGVVTLTFAPNSNECAAPISTTIEVETATPYIAEQFDPICNTSTAITLNTDQGGVLGNWSGNIVQNNTLDPQVTAGNYTITFRPNERCAQAQTRDIQILDAPRLTLDTSPATCDEAVGSVSATVSGGQPFTLTFSVGDQTSSQPSFSDLAAGNYIFVADDGQCVTEEPFTIDGTPGVEFTTTPDITRAATCNVGASISVAAAGTGTIFYSINGTDFQSNNQFNNLAPGTYEVTARDANFCFATTMVEIPVPVEPNITSVVPNATTCGEDNGTIRVTANGTGQLEYAIGSAPFEQTSTFTDLASGDYEVTVRDETGCTTTSLVTIATSEQLSIQSVVPTAAKCGTNNGSLFVDLGNATGTYEYVLNNGNPQNSPQFDNLEAGEYTIQVTDENGCTDTSTATVATTDEPTIDRTAVMPDNCQTNSGRVEIFTTATTPLTYSINGGAFVSENIFE